MSRAPPGDILIHGLAESQHTASTGHPTPRLRQVTRDAASRRAENQWLSIPEQELTIGYEDPESDDGPDRYFAWDNEREPYDVKVGAFEAQARPVTVGEYAAFLVDADKTDTTPATWVKLATIAKTRLSPHQKKNDGDESGSPNGVVSRGHNAGNTRLRGSLTQHGILTVWGPIPYPKG